MQIIERLRVSVVDVVGLRRGRRRRRRVKESRRTGRTWRPDGRLHLSRSGSGRRGREIHSGHFERHYITGANGVQSGGFAGRALSTCTTPVMRLLLGLLLSRKRTCAATMSAVLLPLPPLLPKMSRRLAAGTTRTTGTERGAPTAPRKILRLHERQTRRGGREQNATRGESTFNFKIPRPMRRYESEIPVVRLGQRRRTGHGT